MSCGKIVLFAGGINAAAKRTIEAQGLYVVPGFIDIHSHSDYGLSTPPVNANPNMIVQGMTTGW
ncbi:MAG: hypothetical protein ONB46_18850 [candidate division KSB1 bacterium]|nr:hypothetical protein [candidate division KSB1 bacterium]MDZ7367980.1 hypothetical protein [candidate division KSB1 bacterium]MDZ7405603.1 hypothetical protein [candidate division KSB1 bacterium]